MTTVDIAELSRALAEQAPTVAVDLAQVSDQGQSLLSDELREDAKRSPRTPFTPKELEVQLKCGPSTVVALLRGGRIPSYLDGGRRVIPPGALLAHKLNAIARSHPRSGPALRVKRVTQFAPKPHRIPTPQELAGLRRANDARKAAAAQRRAHRKREGALG